jgi:AcrR family transcriptional regulator
MTTDRGQKTREKVIRAATDLFAEHGFHGVTTRDIAKSAKVNIATIHYHVGTKEELYMEVFRRGYAREFLINKQFIDSIKADNLSDQDQLRKAIREFVSAVVDLNVEDPNLAKLSIRRQFSQDEQSRQIDEMFSLPMYKEIGDYLAQGIKNSSFFDEVFDLRFFFTGFIWTLNGLVTSGVIDFENLRVPIESNEMVKKTKDFLYLYCCTFLGISP